MVSNRQTLSNGGMLSNGRMLLSAVKWWDGVGQSKAVELGKFKRFKLCRLISQYLAIQSILMARNVRYNETIERAKSLLAATPRFRLISTDLLS